MEKIKLPSLGEGFEKGLVISVLVNKGDRIAMEQPLLEIETDKVTVEIPAYKEGIIEDILIKVGEEVVAGQELMLLQPENVDHPREVENGKYLAEATQREPRIEDEKESLTTPNFGPEPNSPPIFSRVIKENQKIILASPLARKLAREIGVDISKVRGNAPSGRIAVEDVKAHSRQLHQKYATSPTFGAPGLPDFSYWGPIRREKCPPITQATALNVSNSWSYIPHAWVQDQANITLLEAKRKEYKDQVKLENGKLTITAILVRVVSRVLSKFPLFNSSYDSSANELIRKDYQNIGIAVDTERGLVVPVIKDLEKLALTQVAVELNTISKKARHRKLTTEDLSGATFTISNLGGLGTTGIFPIVNYPQVAILGVAASHFQPVWQGDGFNPELMMPMTLGFDHRIINGADAARFLKAIKDPLENPENLFNYRV